MQPSLTHCAKSENCLSASGNEVSVCLTDQEARRYVDTAPLIPAERLCLRGLGAVRESRASSQLVDTLASVSFDIDRAIAIPSLSFNEHGDLSRDNRALKQDLLRQISMMLSHVPDIASVGSTADFPVAAQLKRLGIFMPFFRARMEATSPSASLVKQVHTGLCSHIGHLDKLMHDGSSHAVKKQRLAHKAECEVMALVTRQGIAAYPALQREEASHARKQYNHDFYTLRRTTKRPVQVKTSSSGSGYDGVPVIRHYDILRSFKRDPVTHQVKWEPSRGHEEFEWPNPYTYEQVLQGEAPDPLAELLVEESSGSRLSRDKLNTLNLATSYVLSRIG